jgi:hypothetical protein
VNSPSNEDEAPIPLALHDVARPQPSVGINCRGGGVGIAAMALHEGASGFAPHQKFPGHTGCGRLSGLVDELHRVDAERWAADAISIVDPPRRAGKNYRYRFGLPVHLPHLDLGEMRVPHVPVPGTQLLAVQNQSKTTGI